MELIVFGTPTCPKCKITVKELQALIDAQNLQKAVEFKYLDMTTVDGLAEGAFYDVGTVPTTILFDKESEIIGRWEGDVPPMKDVTTLIRERA